MISYIYLAAFLIFFTAGSGYAKNYAIMKRYSFKFMTEKSRKKIEEKYLAASIIYSSLYILTCIFLMDFADKIYRLAALVIYLIFLIYYFLIFGRRGGSLSEEKEKAHLKTKNNNAVVVIGVFIGFIVFSLYFGFRVRG
jgi:uncharacterized membrane protein YfcA